jgi:hypothetical protein
MIFNPAKITKKSQAKYNQGIFSPMNPAKLRNNNGKPIIFRSGWEAEAFRWCDRNSNVVEWTSENTPIPFVDPVDRAHHIFFPDLWIKYHDAKDGKLVQAIVEVKPSTEVPAFAMARYKETGRKPSAHRMTILARNNAKFQSAQRWCDAHGMRFIILTEFDLKMPKTKMVTKTTRQLVRGASFGK